ncbi:MAG: DUF4962 domain-containing protein [Verrucomicrobia bacterium]|nr:DUF4962 domain-containing protein [Verrucomicrobiota bacterium]
MRFLSIFRLALGLTLAGIVSSHSESNPTAKLSVINYADKPIPATAAAVPLPALWSALGLSEGTPLEAETADGRSLPILASEENGAPVAYIYFGLNKYERLDITVRQAPNWSNPVAKTEFEGDGGEISNGILSLQLKDGKWNLSFIDPQSENQRAKTELVKDCWLDFWLDVESRGRLLGMTQEKIRDLGLVPGMESKIIHSQTKINPDRSVSLNLQRGFEGAASEVVLHETYTLLAAQPVLTYQCRFTTRGSSKWYVANVEHAAGMRGIFGNLLKSKMQFKYDNPREPSRVLLYGKENSFTRVGWRPERCWVGVDGEFGHGIGFSTSRSVDRPLPGTVVWVIGRDFFLRLLDQEQENYPYEFSAEKPLEMGLAFVATSGGTGIWNQTKNLYKSVTTDKKPKVTNSYAIYLDGEPLECAEVSQFEMEDSLQALVNSGHVESAAWEMDFQRGYVLKIQAQGATPENPISISAYLLGKKAQKIKIATLSNSEPTEVDFSKATGWQGKRQKFVIEVERPEGTTLHKLALQPVGLPAPELGSPSDGLNLTDIATFFRWRQLKGALDYEIQLSTDESFTNPKILKVRSEVEWPYYMPTDSELPAPGKWFWRIRGLEEDIPGQWSAVRSFTINNDITKKPVTFTISSQKPLFTIEAYMVKDLSLFKETIPPDLKPSVAINCKWTYADAATKKRIDPIAFLKPTQDAGITGFVRTHGPAPISAWLPISDLEEIFQKYPNIIGNMGGETLSALFHGGDNQTYMSRVLKLCGKYGRYFYEADGTYPSENKWQSLYEKSGPLMKEYADHLIFAQKNNILHRQFVSQSSVLGLYLSGAISNQGAWEDGGWYWQQTGFRRLGEILGQRSGDTDMPRNFWNLNFLMGLARGCAIFSFEGQCGSLPVGKGWKIAEKGFPPNRQNFMAYWTTQGELTPTFHRFLAPFMRAVIQKQLVPSKEEVLKNIHLAVYNDGVPKKEDGDQYYYEWKPLYEGTYGFKDYGVIPGTLMEFFPDTGRYYYFPVFPQGKVDLGHRIETLPLSQLGNPAEVRKIFDQAYPKWYEGDALVNIVGNTLAIMNSNENRDETQTYAIPLTNRGDFLNISGTIKPHAYVMGKFENQSLWIQAQTEYTGHDTELRVTFKKSPQVTVTPPQAAKLNQWDEKTKTLSLILSHTDGAVEVDISE